MPVHIHGTCVYVKFSENNCERHAEKDIVDVARIKHFNPRDWDKNKYYKIKCGDGGKCTAIVIFVRDTIEELQKVINTKRAVLPPKYKINTADESTTDVDNNNYITAKKKENKSEEIQKLLDKKIGLIRNDAKENAFVNENDQPISHKDTSIEPLSERNTDYEKENKVLKLKIIEKDKKIADQLQMINELTTLNMDLQKSVISYFEEFKVSSEKFDEMRSLEGVQTLPVGFIRKADNTIHLGRDVWLPKSTYDAAICNTRSRQMIVKNLTLAVFGIKTLQNSSITGMKCNKFKELKPKPKLDERKNLAIGDIFRYWMINVAKISEVDAQIECSKVSLYISKKISDLNRKHANSKKAKKQDAEAAKATESVEEAETIEVDVPADAEAIYSDSELNEDNRADANEDVIYNIQYDDSELNDADNKNENANKENNPGEVSSAKNGERLPKATDADA